MKKLLISLGLLAAARLLAVAPVPFSEAVNFTTTVTGSITSTLTVYGESTVNVSNNVSGGPQESAITTVWLRPGKLYPMTMAGGVSSGTGTYKLSFTTTQGYVVYIDDLPADLFVDSSVSGTYSDSHTLEIRPMGASGGGAWGSFNGISVGKGIVWSVGLGDLRTGRSAGSIQFREQDLTGSPASRSRLYYSVPANVGQIGVIADGPSYQTLRQIVTPAGFADLVNTTGGYLINFYTWSQLTGWNGSLYTFGSAPWKTIQVESTAANQLKVTETEGSVVRTSNLTGTGTFGPVGATGGTVTTSGGNTIHTFNSSGIFAITNGTFSIDTLVVGGGGGGGSYSSGNSGGGGGGDVNEQLAQTLSTGSYAVVIGAGGAADASGSNSTFNGITAYGGGRGGGNSAPLAGGSSGGGTVNNNSGAPPAAGSGSKVFKGGDGILAPNYDGGGGGGATTVGVQAGGAGYTAFDGNTYGGGGGGGNHSGSSPNSGGAGGGGRGGYNDGGSKAGVAGTANTGGGGGGGGGDGYGAVGPGAAGGSGKVVIRYATSGGGAGVYTWTLQEGSGSTWLRTTTHTSTVPASNQRDDVVVVRTGGTSGTVVAKTKYHYVTKPWGSEELDSVIADPDAGSPADRTTTYTYYETAPTSGNDEYTGNYRRIKSVTEPTGNWVAYHYYNDFNKRGQLHYEFRPFTDTTTGGVPAIDTDAQADTAAAATHNGRVVHFGYDYDWTTRHRALVSQIVKIDNVATAKTTRDQDFDYSSTPRNRFTQNDFFDGTSYLQTYVQSWREDVGDADFVGHPYLLVTPNVAQTSTSVSRGGYNSSTKAFTVGSSGDSWRVLVFHGSYTSAGGADAVTGFDSQSCDSVWMLPNKSTVDVTIRGGNGAPYRTETWVWTGTTNGFKLMTSEDFAIDAYGRVYQRLANNGALTIYSYTDGQLRSTVGPDGTEIQYTYDLLGRIATSIKKGAGAAGSYAAQADITTTYTYDGADHVTQTVTSGGSLSLTATAAYDLAGRLTSSTAPGSYATTYGYTSGGRTVTTTMPGGATRVTEAYPDGQPKSLTGTAVVGQYTSYAVNSTPGTITRQVNFGTSASTALVRTTADWLGRQLAEVKPGGTGTGDATRTWTYDAYYGYLNKLTQTGLADTLYLYDTMGGLRREGLDLGADGALDLASSDRVTDHAWEFFSTGTGVWWRRETASTYATAGNSTPTSMGKVETQLSGFTAAGGGFTRLARTDSYDVFGNVTTSYTEVKSSGKETVTTTDVPDSTTDAVQTAYNGLTVSSRSTANLTTTFGYDDLGRQTTSVDPRTGTTTTAYVSGTSQVYTVTDAATVVQATYTYDSAGRVSSVKDALNKYAYTSYTNRGEVYRQWGDTAVPAEYAYDNWGRQVTMKTYRGGTGWTASDWPGTGSNTGTSPGTADYTSWVYDEATGLLQEKYDDANLDPSTHLPISGAKKISYTYTQAGQIDVRIWARGVTTDYDYSSTTGELSAVSYSDSTPDLSYTYNRLGRIAGVGDATGTTSSHTFTYALGGTLELEREDLPSFFGTRRVTYGYATSGVIGRPDALKLGTSGSPTADQSIAYSYDTCGRFNSLAGGGTTLAYSYTSGSNLLAGIADSTSGWAQTRTYLSNRDLLDVIETKVSTTSKAKFDYAHDNLGRRTSVARTGGLFSIYGDGTEGLVTAWGYDDRSQLTSEVTTLGTGGGLTGRNDAYAYDTMGNRASSAGTTHNSNAAAYTTNALNQYTQRTVPGVFDVAGSAGSGATVTVNGSSSGVVRHGEYFFKPWTMSNGSSPVFTSLSISDGGAPQLLDAFTPVTPEPFTYDDDGNLTRDGRWVYQYDAENRLVAMFTRGAPADDPLYTVTANSAVWGSGLTGQKLQFTYDYLGRRVEKLASNWVSSAWSPVSDLKFVYDGWNIMARLNAASSNALVASYYWGLDWSGTMQGAGGVGGLAIVVEGGNTYLPAYDGNGNVMGMIKASDGSLAAAYEYDAFGQTLRESGPYAAGNPFRFATKYADVETGLVQYNTRYYSPSLGRFLNRDTISEQGGLNLYACCGNNGVNKWDMLGREEHEAGWMPEWARIFVDYMKRTYGQWNFPGMTANPVDRDLYGGPNGRSSTGPASTSLLDRLAYDRTDEGRFTDQDGLLGSTKTGDSRGPIFTGTVGVGDPEAFPLDKIVAKGSDSIYPGDSVVSPYAPNNAAASWTDRVGNAVERAANWFFTGIDPRKGSRPTVGSALVGGIAAGNVKINATPPGIAVSLGSTKLGVESGLSNPRPRSFTGRDIAGNPLYSFGTVYDSKTSLFVSYGVGRLDFASRSSQFYSGWSNQWGGMPVTESFGGQWSFFDKASLSLSREFGGLEVGGGMNFDRSGPDISIFNFQTPLGGFELTVGPKY